MQTARGLLAATVDPTIRTIVQNREPNKALKEVVALCKMQDSRAMDIATTELEKLTLSKCASMTDYFNKAVSFRQDILDLKGSYTEEQLKSKLLRGLPAHFSFFVDHFQLLQDDPNMPNADLKTLFSMLLGHESKFKERQARSRPFAAPFTARGRNGTDTGSGNFKQGNKCSICNKGFHRESDCWVAHPDKRPKTSGNGRYGKSGGMAAAATTNEEAFHDRLTESMKNHDKDTGNKGSFLPRGTPQAFQPLVALAETHPQPSQLIRMGSKGEQWKGHGRPLLQSDFFVNGVQDNSSKQCTVATDLNNKLSVMSLQDQPVSKDTWILDCGANMCICNDLKWFSEFHPFRMEMSMVDNTTSLPILGGGTVMLSMAHSANESFELTLRNVVYAPSSRCNLLSQSKLAKTGIHGRWKGKALQILSPDDLQIGSAFVVNGLYHVQLNHHKETIPSNVRQAPFVANVDFTHPVWVWHRRLGHLSLDRMKTLLEHSTGMGVTLKQLKSKMGSICPICATTKAVVKIPRDPARRLFDKLGMLLHIDLWGKYSIPGWDGTQYFCFMVDDANRFTWSLRLKTRDEAPDAIRKKTRQLEREFQMKVRRTRVDNELDKGPWKAYAIKKGILVEPTATYSHNQVGVAERVNRTIREGANAMIEETQIGGQVKRLITLRAQELLREGTIPEFLWPEAIDHAVWLKNRAPTRAKGKKTPWERLYNQQPDLSRERVWGSRCYVAYTREERTTRQRTRKLHDPRGWLGYFVGAENESTYRIWDPVAKTVKRVMTARIDEGEGLDDDHEESAYTRAQTDDNNDMTTSERPGEFVDFLDGQEEPGNLSEHSDSETTSETSESEHEVENVTNDAAVHVDTSSEDHNSDEDEDAPPVRSRFFSHAVFMAKRKNEDYRTGPRGKRGKYGQIEFEKTADGKFKCDQCDKTYSQKAGALQHRRDHEATDSDRTCPKCGKLLKTLRGLKDHIPRCEHLKDNDLSDSGSSSEEDAELPKVKKADASKVNTQTPWEERCYYCYHSGSNCKKDENSDSCQLCLKRKGKCKPLELQADGTLPPIRWGYMKGRVPVNLRPLHERCYECASAIRRCDGEYPFDTPCTSCTDRGKRCISNEQHDRERNLPKCKACRSDKLRCDRKEPCSSCIKFCDTCTYDRGDREMSFRVTLGDDGDKFDPENSRCLTCKHGGRCNVELGGPPCRPCMNSRHGGKWCSWWPAPGQNERIKKTAFGLKQDANGKWYQSTGNGSDNEAQAAIDNDSGSDGDETVTQRLAKLDKLLQEAESHRSKTRSALPKTANLVFLPEVSPPLIAMAAQTQSTITNLATAPVPQTWREAVTGPEGRLWRAAIESEYNSLLQNHTWEVVDQVQNRKPLTTRWVLKRKLGPDGEITKYKARMVARGFQQVEGFDYSETYSGVVKAASYRMLFALMAISGWYCHQMDVITAFLNGDLLEEVYTYPPEGFPEPGKVLRLRKALYGLKQAPRQWYWKLREWLVNNGWEPSSYDDCVFLHPGRKLIITVYVDDINIFGAQLQYIEAFKHEISNAFSMTDAGKVAYYLGTQIQESTKGVHLHQAGFVRQMLNKFNMANVTPTYIPLRADEKLLEETSTEANAKFRHEYMSKVGSLNYLQSKTRPDQSYSVSLVSRYMKNPNQQHMDAVDQILAYSAGTATLGLFYRRNGDPTIQGYVDSDWGGCKDTGKSTTGWIFTLAGAPISWASQRQRTVSSSSTEAEYIAASDACKEAMWLKGFHGEICTTMGLTQQNSIDLYIDNASAIKLTKNPEFHGRTKHIDIRHHFIRECVRNGHVTPKWISGQENIADLLTKALHRPKFRLFRGTMGVERADSSEGEYIT